MMETITRLNPTQIKAFQIGKPFLHSPLVHQTGGSLAKLRFSNKKSFNKLHRNFSKGKGCRLCRSDLDDIQLSTNGGSIWGSISNAFKPVASAFKPIGSAVADVAMDAVKEASPALGQIVDVGKSAGKVLGSKEAIGVYKAIGKEAIPVIANAGAEALGAAAGAYAGPVAGKLVSNLAKKGAAAGSKRAVRAIDGAGLYVGKGLYVGGNIGEAQLSETDRAVGLGGSRTGSFGDDVKSRMARVRSFKRQSGAGLVPL
jgi:hypothetical protein